jgi:hypothetical protein
VFKNVGVAVAVALCLGLVVLAPAKTVTWSGYTWNVKNGGRMDPGNNYWSENNVWVDTAGLHLKLTKSGSIWNCAEVWTTRTFPFGRYQFWVVGRIDQLDKNVVFGMFNYPPGGPDKTNEIDIEFARWGSIYSPIGNFGVWPRTLGGMHPTYPFSVSLNGTYTTHRWVWRSTSVYFQSLHGHRNDNQYQIASWTTPSNFASLVPQQAEPVHINLWLYKGLAPTNGQNVEVVLKSFTYAP